MERKKTSVADMAVLLIGRGVVVTLYISRRASRILLSGIGGIASMVGASPCAPLRFSFWVFGRWSNGATVRVSRTVERLLDVVSMAVACRSTKVMQEGGDVRDGYDLAHSVCMVTCLSFVMCWLAHVSHTVSVFWYVILCEPRMCCLYPKASVTSTVGYKYL